MTKHRPVGALISGLVVDDEGDFLATYERLLPFGGTWVYFHIECLRVERDAFLSQRHIEMIYATLSASGMNRKGEAEATP